MAQWERLTRRSPLASLARHDLRAGTLVLCSVVGVALLAWLDLSATGRLGPAFGVGFVLLSLTCATAADVRALFTPGVLPPLLMVGTVWAVAVWAPQGIDVDGLAAGAGTLQRVVAGVVDQATALVVGHLAALGVVGARIMAASRRGADDAGAARDVRPDDAAWDDVRDPFRDDAAQA